MLFNCNDTLMTSYFSRILYNSSYIIQSTSQFVNLSKDLQGTYFRKQISMATSAETAPEK